MEEPKERKKLDPNSPVVQRVMRIRARLAELGIPPSSPESLRQYESPYWIPEEYETLNEKLKKKKQEDNGK